MSNSGLIQKRLATAGVEVWSCRGADGTLRIVEANLDECVLCDLCIQAAPGTVPGGVKLLHKGVRGH